MTGIPAILTLLLAALLPLALPAQAQERQKKIIIGGAQSIVPLAEQFSAQFLKEHPGTEIEIVGGGSNYAVNATQRGEIDIGLVTRSLSAEEKTAIYAEPFGQDAILILTHPGNVVPNLALEEIRRIYLGQITNWREVGGEELGIIPLTREKSAAIHTIFTDRLFGKGLADQEKAFILRASKEKVLKTIKRVEGVIGYGILRLDQAQTQGIKVLAVEARLPTDENIRAGLYPLVRPQLLISRGKPQGLAREWMLGFVKFGQRSVKTEQSP